MGASSGLRGRDRSAGPFTPNMEWPGHYSQVVSHTLHFKTDVCYLSSSQHDGKGGGCESTDVTNCSNNSVKSEIVKSYGSKRSFDWLGWESTLYERSAGDRHS